jgi:polyisoprenoid-binding protein YceI
MVRTIESACFVVALLSAAWALPAGGQAFRTEQGQAEFTSSVPLHTFTGRSEHLNGRIYLAEQSVDFFLDLETLRTGIGKRDRDMRATLETDQYPFAEFVGRLTTPFNPDRAGEQAVRVVGTFTLHGVSRQIVVDGSLERVAGGIRVRAAWDVHLEEYDVVPPRLLVVRVDPVQKLRIDAVLAPESP